MRPSRAVIDLAALVHNFKVARQSAAQNLMAVLKADAYGHGLIPCAQALAEHADAFAVAFIEEAEQLVAAGITHKPIVLLEGFLDPAELVTVAEHSMICVLHSSWQIEAIAAAKLTKPIDVWLKVDTGMHRLGFQPSEAPAIWAQLQAMPQVNLLGISTHFARADEADCPATANQLTQIQQLQKQLNAKLSVANSAAVMSLPELYSDWARPGIMLYGANPCAGQAEIAQQLRPVMTLESKIIGVQTLAAGEAIGYGGTYVTSQPSRIGIVAIGYADGYPRQIKNGTPVMVDGQLTTVIGRVAMDMLTVDISQLPNANIGSSVELWGKQISVDQVAASADTIGYQLLCNLKRVPRIYLPAQ